MSGLTIFFAALYYVATVVLVVGVGLKIAQYARTPAPLKIPTTPAPTTTGGVVLRMAREVGLFESLFRSDKILWVFAVAFHLGMLLVAIRHLRYVTDPVWTVVVWLQPFGIYGGIAMVLGLLALLARRIVLPRVRYITNPSDILMLVLFIAIGLSGLSMKYAAHTDVIAVKGFFLGLMRLSPQPLPGDPLLLVHLGLVAALMLVFPFSKLLHAPGVFFSPTRNQADNSRQRRHLAPWAKPLDSVRDGWM